MRSLRSSTSTPGPVILNVMSLSERKMKSRLTISIRTMIVLVLAACIGLNWFNQWQQHHELLDMNERLSTAESELEYQRCISVVVSGLNPHDDIDQKALQIIGRARLHRNPNGSPDEMQQIMPDNPRQIAIEGNEENRSVVIFCNNSHSYPGWVDTVAALIENERLTDFRIRESNTRIEWHTTSVEDLDSDGSIDLVFNCRPGGFRMEQPEKMVSYSIDDDGFGDMVESSAQSHVE